MKHLDAVAAWVNDNYRPDRLDRTPYTRASLIADRLADLMQHGYTLISHHDCLRRDMQFLADPKHEHLPDWVREIDAGRLTWVNEADSG